MSVHICTVCFLPAHLHDDACPCGCGHFLLPLCCEGCGCRSYEEAHGESPFTPESQP